MEQISLMDAQQLLSYLSEIIGTHEYEELLAEQAKKCATICLIGWCFEALSLRMMPDAAAAQQQSCKLLTGSSEDRTAHCDCACPGWRS